MAFFFPLVRVHPPPSLQRKERDGGKGRKEISCYTDPPPPSSSPSFVPRSFYCDVIFYAPWPPVLARSNGPFYRFVAINEIYYRTIDRSIDTSLDLSNRRFFETKFVLLEINCGERERERVKLDETKERSFY